MKFKPATCFFAFSALLMSACTAMHDPGSTQRIVGWSDRSAFTFGDIALDFPSGLERDLGGRRHPLVDCSTDDLFCARGEVIRVVVPRNCDDIRTASAWSTNGISTVVMGRETEPLTPHRVGSGNRLLLADPARPQVLYEYDDMAGILSIYYDPIDQTDFAAIARRGELDAYRQSKMYVRPFPNYRHFLSTRQAFGRCLTNGL